MARPSHPGPRRFEFPAAFFICHLNDALFAGFFVQLVIFFPGEGAPCGPGPGPPREQPQPRLSFGGPGHSPARPHDVRRPGDPQASAIPFSPGKLAHYHLLMLLPGEFQPFPTPRSLAQTYDLDPVFFPPSSKTQTCEFAPSSRTSNTHEFFFLS